MWSDLAEASILAYDIDINTTLKYCNKALELDQNNWNLLSEMVFNIYIDKDPFKAIELLERIMLIDDADVPNAGRHLADLYKKIGDTEKAIKTLEKLLESYPQSAHILESLGFIYYEMENYEKTLEY